MIQGKAPFISVVIPTYNRLELLKLTVDSVRNQSYDNFEIIVVDDGATDGTGKWLDQQDDLIVVHQSNSGIAAARNKGISMAGGDWVSFVDHDDIWAREKLRIQADFIGENPECHLVAARHIRLGTPGPWIGRPRWIKGDLFVDLFSKSFVHTSSVIIRKDVIESIGGFPTRYRFADEFHVWLKIAAQSHIAYYTGALVFIRFYESNTSHDRVGVRTDTHQILMNHYDPFRIPRSIFLRTMSDHDISFGRAYLKAGDMDSALAWFKKSVQRTPWRPRSLRYYLKYLALSKLRGFRPKGSQG